MNPLATSAAEGREILAAARRHPNQKTMLFPAFPAGPYIREDSLVRRLLAEGTIGRVLQVNYFWHTPFLALGSYYEVLRNWVGEHQRILAVRRQFPAQGQRRLVANVILAELSNGGLVTYSHSTVMGSGATDPRIELHGETGTIIVYAERPGIGEVRGSPTVLLSTGDEKPKPVPVPSDLQAAWDDPRLVPAEEHFVRWVLDGTPSLPASPTFEDGLKSLEFAEAFLASAQSGAWVDLPK